MSVFSSAKKKLIKRFGSVDESTPGDYWKQYGYEGPFSCTPQGKFFLNASMDSIHEYVHKLKPYVRNNEIIGIKHPLQENQPGDSHFGKEPVLVIYTTRKKRKAVEDILEKENIKGVTWTEENPLNSPLFMNNPTSATKQYKDK